MKTHRTFSTLLLAIALFLSGSVVAAQDKESEQKKKQAEMEQEMQAKKEMQAAMEAEMNAKKQMLWEQQEQMKYKQKEMENQERKMREIERHYAEQARSMERQSRESSRARASSRSSGGYSEGAYVAPMIVHQNQSQLTLRNSFRGGSDTSKGEFDVESGIHQFRCMISGKVNSGEIYIKVEYPGGKVFKELTINSAAEITFSQSLRIKEGEEDKYIGAWKYQVRADKAEGNYMLQIMTN